MKHLLFTCAALSCALALSACGSSGDGGGAGNGGGTGTAGCTSDIPQSAQASVEGLVGYTKQLVAAGSDTGEPLSTCNMTLPTDETSEPSS